VRYLCHVYADPERLARLPAAKRATFDGEWIACEGALRWSRRLLAAGGVACGEEPLTVHVRDRVAAITESASGGDRIDQERLAGFLLVEARDLNDALRIAATLPTALPGRMDVRPVATPPCPGSPGSEIG
jgi:hypothetical protein